MFILAGINTADQFQASAFVNGNIVDTAEFYSAAAMALWIKTRLADRVSLVSTAYAGMDVLREELERGGIAYNWPGGVAI